MFEKFWIRIFPALTKTVTWVSKNMTQPSVTHKLTLSTPAIFTLNCPPSYYNPERKSWTKRLRCLIVETLSGARWQTLTDVKHHELWRQQATVPSAAKHNHCVTNKNSRMKKPWNTTRLLKVPFSTLGLIIKCVAGCFVTGAVKHSVSSMYIDTSCICMKRTAVSIRWSYVTWCTFNCSPHFVH